MITMTTASAKVIYMIYVYIIYNYYVQANYWCKETLIMDDSAQNLKFYSIVLKPWFQSIHTNEIFSNLERCIWFSISSPLHRHAFSGRHFCWQTTHFCAGINYHLLSRTLHTLLQYFCALGKWNDWCFRPQIYTCKAILGRGQPVNEIFVMNHACPWCRIVGQQTSELPLYHRCPHCVLG